MPVSNVAISSELIASRTVTLAPASLGAALVK